MPGVATIPLTEKELARALDWFDQLKADRSQNVSQADYELATKIGGYYRDVASCAVPVKGALCRLRERLEAEAAAAWAEPGIPAGYEHDPALD